MNEKNLGQKCSRCDGLMEQWRRGKNPVCMKCQREAQWKRNRIRSNIILPHSWTRWICDCPEMYLYERGTENNMCWMGCCKKQPTQ